MLRPILFITALSLVLVAANDAKASSPTGWSPIIIPTGVYRERIKSTPIHQRPGRPLHVYGNTVRLIRNSRVSNEPIRPLRQIFLGSSTRVRSGR
ncbi:hypothetical protein [Aporhodopirellula aestuarii]|uniref:Secreted protein n=1 Tax=Aporhodopirellula aestuarii TaxID=2950107 RepID=A0ABT0UD37_9BACT|nr:hypothetical protein [Aporhodopirellula aestuarii]MCM2374288.1 hypothetical protein [Aporhodopirellula aestuarii]